MNAQLKLTLKKIVTRIKALIATPDWEQNNSSSLGFILHRSHYKVGGNDKNLDSDQTLTLSLSDNQAKGSIWGYGQYPTSPIDFFSDIFALGKKVTVSIFKDGNFKSFSDIVFYPANNSGTRYLGNPHLAQPNNPAYEDNRLDWCIYCDSPGYDSLHFILPKEFVGEYESGFVKFLSQDIVYIKKLADDFLSDNIQRKITFDDKREFLQLDLREIQNNSTLDLNGKYFHYINGSSQINVTLNLEANLPSDKVEFYKGIMHNAIVTFPSGGIFITGDKDYLTISGNVITVPSSEYVEFTYNSKTKHLHLINYLSM